MKNPKPDQFKIGYKAGYRAGQAVRKKILKVLVNAAVPLEALKASVTWELCDEIKAEIDSAVKQIREIINQFGKD